jgi:hypothetical protein
VNIVHVTTTETIVGQSVVSNIDRKQQHVNNKKSLRKLKLNHQTYAMVSWSVVINSITVSGTILRLRNLAIQPQAASLLQSLLVYYKT